jgi:protease II
LKILKLMMLFNKYLVLKRQDGHQITVVLIYKNNVKQLKSSQKILIKIHSIMTYGSYSSK